MTSKSNRYERFVASYFKKKGYKVELTPSTHDWGVDVFLEKDSEKIAVQAKMYGATSRKINRRMVMEFYGSRAYFECDKGILVTDGKIMPDAEKVAEKLGIKVLFVSMKEDISSESHGLPTSEFEQIWEKYVIPLEGKILYRDNGKSNKILKVDWGGVERITSNQKKQSIDIEIFRQAINYILAKGSITRKQINEEYDKRASSGIVLILSHIPYFKLNKDRPMAIELRK